MVQNSFFIICVWRVINYSKTFSLSSVCGEFLVSESGDFLLCMLKIMFRLIHVTLTESKSNKRFSICVLPNPFYKTFSRVAGNTVRSYCLCLQSTVMLHINDYLQREIFIFCLTFSWRGPLSYRNQSIDLQRTLPQRCYNVNTTLSMGLLDHFTTDYSDFFPFIEMWKLQKC